MRQPDEYDLDRLVDSQNFKRITHGPFVPRPAPSWGMPWTWRWRVAFRVLTGECDAIRWRTSDNE